jgi:transcriptional regulator with GAF, ATPase, and Fis domain
MPVSDETATHDFGRPRGKTPEAGLVLLFSPIDDKLPKVVRLATQLAIGREPPPGGLAIPHSGVSRLHARIHRTESAWVLTDLDSRNGTIVDGCRIKSLALEEGDEVRIGDALFRFVEHDLDAYLDVRDLPPLLPGMVGGARMRRFSGAIHAVAASDLPILVLGETGTGKEVVARAVHEASGRPGKLSAINCAAIPMNLLESELFGYKRGAFSGADRDKPGLVSVAHRGTLFLDEIGDLALEAQAKLLRLLETREVLPLGAVTPEKVDVRLVSATHRDLAKLVETGRFRGDLYARVAGHTARLPALRDRKEDLPLLVPHLLARHGGGGIAISVPFMLALLHYDWPFNVRELEAGLRRAIALVTAEKGPRVLEERHLPESVAKAMEGYGAESAPPAARESGSIPPPRAGAPTEAEMRALLEKHQGNVAAMARELRKDRVQVHRWMKKWHLAPTDYRK